MTTMDDVIRAAASVARDVTEGRVSTVDLETVAADECRELFGVVAGPSDPLWSLHVDIARQVLGLGGVPADEIQEWLAVARHRATPNPPVASQN